MSLHCTIGPSWAELQCAIEVLRASGLHEVAWSIEGVLSGEDPREQFSLARLRSVRLANRNRMIGELRIAAYSNLEDGPASKLMAKEWAHYASTLAGRDRVLRGPPAKASISRHYWWALDRQGSRPLGARQLKNVIEGCDFALAAAFREEINSARSRNTELGSE